VKLISSATKTSESRGSIVLALVLFLMVPAIWAQNGTIVKNGLPLDIRSHGRQIADEVAKSGPFVAVDPNTPVPGVSLIPPLQIRGGGGVQTNNPFLDNIQIFSGFRPFVEFTQSETSVAGVGQNIVAAYNSSANQPLEQINPTTLAFTHRFLSAFSTSNNGGKSWTSGFLPPIPGSIFTFVYPVVHVDRHGNFYFAGLGANAASQSTVQVNKSTDGGRTWSDAVIVQQDSGSDKEWLAVGPDPFDKSRDNVYVSWTSFQASGEQLRFGVSKDGGATFSARTIFAPVADPNPAHPQNHLQFSNVYVDPITGFVYIPFAHFSNSDVDFLQILVSADAGATFRFLTFNRSGAPDPTLQPVVQPGELTDCFSSGGLRLVIHAGPDQGGRFGLRSFVESSRLTIQPTFAARNGVIYMAWSNSTSGIFGDPASQSNILFIRSDDGGATWTDPIQVNPAVSSDIHHVLPSLAIDQDPSGNVHVAYYTQHPDGTVDVDMANSFDRGNSFFPKLVVRVTPAAETLAPTNIKLTTNTSTNYDRTIRPCYCLGEYLSVKSTNGMQYVLWGDLRNSVTEPVNALDPLSGQTHPQEDVFFQIVQLSF